MAWNPPAPIVPGVTVVSGFLNALRESLLQLVAVPASYTVAPTGVTAFAWTASGTNPAIGNGTITAEFGFLGAGEISFRIRIVMGSTTSYGSGTWLFQLPLLPSMIGNEAVFSSVVMYDASAPIASSRRTGAAYVNSAPSGTIALLDAATNTAVTASAPFAWATGDVLSIAGRYIAA